MTETIGAAVKRFEADKSWLKLLPEKSVNNVEFHGSRSQFNLIDYSDDLIDYLMDKGRNSNWIVQHGDIHLLFRKPRNPRFHTKIASGLVQTNLIAPTLLTFFDVTSPWENVDIGLLDRFAMGGQILHKQFSYQSRPPIQSEITAKILLLVSKRRKKEILKQIKKYDGLTEAQREIERSWV